LLLKRPFAQLFRPRQAPIVGSSRDRVRECDRGTIDQCLRHKPIGPKSLDLYPFNPGMLLASASHSGGHLLFYVTAEQKVRLHDDAADRTAAPGSTPSSTSSCRIRNRFIQRRSGRGHEPQFDA
jgi:hypothetical protein